MRKRSPVQWKQIRLSGAMGAVVASVLGLVLLIFGVGQGLRQFSFDLPYVLRPDLELTNALIVSMDDRSHKALAQDSQARWNRGLHAQLLDRLKEYAAQVVVFDIEFDGTTTNDPALLQAVQAHGKVVVGGRFAPVQVPGVGEMWQATPPFAELQELAVWGVAEGADPDGVIRQHFADRRSPNIRSIAWKAAELSGVQGLPDPFALRWLNYFGPPGTIRSFSYVDVLSNSVPASHFSNKVVFVGSGVQIGTTGGKGTDDLPTPSTYWTGKRSPGVELNATAYGNLVHANWLNNPPPVVEVLLMLAAGVGFGLGLSFFRPVSVAVLAVMASLLVFAIDCYTLTHFRLWYCWAIISVVQIPAAALCAVLFRTQQVHKENEALEEQLARRGDRTPLPAGALSPSMTKLSPASAVRQQMREVLQTPRPLAAGDDSPTVQCGPPTVPDCTLIRRIGSGAYGEVWLGTTVLGAYRAIKIVYRKSFANERPFEREFDGIKNFDPLSRSHPGLVHLLHVGRNDELGYFYYLMELADDSSGTDGFDPVRYDPKNLAVELRRRGRLPVQECTEIGLALTDALAYLHEHGLIHRDIKPSNIIFVDGKPKLADIGLVTQIGEGKTFVGTEGFYPPEGPGSPAGDIYSLGKVLYETLTGLNREHFPDLPSGIEEPGDADQFRRLNQVIVKACESNVNKRYSSARQMHHDLGLVTSQRKRWRTFFK